MSASLKALRRQAKRLGKQIGQGEPGAIARAVAHLHGTSDGWKHADFLYVIAKEAGYDSWPKLKFSHEQQAMDRAKKTARLERALYHGQGWVVAALLDELPDLAHAHMGIECALGDYLAVAARLAADPTLATQPINGRSPLLHLSFSKHLQEADAAVLPLAELLHFHGADPDDSYAFEGKPNAQLSALYGALGHVGNMALARWLLEQGANPDDNESLYHATELGHLDGVRLMLEFSARIAGTNALARMLDFDDPEGARLLLEAGADPNEGAQPHPSGTPSYAICALHHAARRGCSARVARVLLEFGAEGRTLQYGHSAYALARMYGNSVFAEELERAGQGVPLSRNEALMAAAADGAVSGRLEIDELTVEQQRMLCRILGFDAPLPHVKRLVELGLDPDLTEEMGMPAIQCAGWQGHRDAVAYLLELGPDLAVKNKYGGDLIGTILHGADNCPMAKQRDHLGCVELALDAGMPLHRFDIDHCAVVELREWLTAWAEDNPERIV